MNLAFCHSWLLTRWYLKVISEAVVTYRSNGPQAVWVCVWVSNARHDAKFGILLCLCKATCRCFHMGTIKMNALRLIMAWPTLDPSQKYAKGETVKDQHIRRTATADYI